MDLPSPTLLLPLLTGDAGSELHLLCICVPYDGLGDVLSLDYTLYFNLWTALGEGERRALALEGVTEDFLARASASAASKVPSLPTCRRLEGSLPMLQKGSMAKEVGPVRGYTALILRELWRREPIWKVADQFAVPRGWLQSLLQGSAAFAGALCRFAQVIILRSQPVQDDKALCRSERSCGRMRSC